MAEGTVVPHNIRRYLFTFRASLVVTDPPCKRRDWSQKSPRNMP
jgi:hypothetical protein